MDGRVAGWLASPRFAVAVLVALAAASAVGGVVHGAGVIRHPAYAALWGVLALSVLVCTARRWRWTLRAILTSTIHLGLVGLIAGFVWNALDGVAAVAHFALGDAVSALRPADNVTVPLGFSARLERIDEEHDPSRRDTIRFLLRGRNDPVEVPMPAPLEEVSAGETGYRLRVIEATERFSEETSVPAEVRRELALDGPAVLVEVRSNAERPDRRWLLVNHPSARINAPVDPAVRLVYLRRPFVRQATAHFTLRDEGGTERSARLAFNEPFRNGGFQFCLTGYDTERRFWALVHVKKDPGAPAVWAGLSLMCLGVSCRRLAGSFRSPPPPRTTPGRQSAPEFLLSACGGDGRWKASS